MHSALSGDVLHNILLCCVQWESVWVQDTLLIYLLESLDKQGMLFDFAVACCSMGLVYQTHLLKSYIHFPYRSVFFCPSPDEQHSRSALLGLSTVIVHDAYNFTFCNWTYLQFDAFCDCEQSDLCRSSWSS